MPPSCSRESPPARGTRASGVDRDRQVPRGLVASDRVGLRSSLPSEATRPRARRRLQRPTLRPLVALLQRTGGSQRPFAMRRRSTRARGFVPPPLAVSVRLVAVVLRRRGTPDAVPPAPTGAL